MSFDAYVKNTFLVFPEPADVDDVFSAKQPSELRRSRSESDIGRVASSSPLESLQASASEPCSLMTRALQSEAGEEACGDSGDDARALDGCTTLMVRNLPRLVTQDMLVAAIHHEGFFGTYHFLYVPMDSRSRGNGGVATNRGFAFVDLMSPDLAKSFYLAFHNRPFFCREAREPLEVRKARLQGLDQLVQYFATKTSKLRSPKPIRQSTVTKPVFVFPTGPRSSGHTWAADKAHVRNSFACRGRANFCPHCGLPRTTGAYWKYRCGCGLDGTSEYIDRTLGAMACVAGPRPL